MGRYLILFLIVLTGFRADNPFFRGKILYEYSFKNPFTGEDISDKLRVYFGAEHHYYIEGSNYKSTNEIGQLTTLYLGKTNTFYQMGANNTAQRFNGNEKSKGDVKIIKLKKKEKILGHDCKVFVLKNNQRKITYYYADDIKVNKDFFINHHLGNWSNYIEASEGALPLKYVVETLIIFGLRKQLRLFQWIFPIKNSHYQKWLR